MVEERKRDRGTAGKRVKRRSMMRDDGRSVRGWFEGWGKMKRGKEEIWTED